MADEKIKEISKEPIKEPIKDRTPVRKEEPSPFDKILEKNRLIQESPKSTFASTQKSSQESERVVRREEQQEKGRDRQSDDKEKDRGKDVAKDERNSSADTGQRVMGRGKKQGDSGSSGQKGGDGRGYGGTAQKKNIGSMKKVGVEKTTTQIQTEGAKFAQEMKAKMQGQHLSREFVQNVVNQMVRFLKAGINKEGDHEVRLDLDDKIFKGLRLRVALKDGKVDVQFSTSSADVRDLFTASADSIKNELTNKGINVGNIKVT